MESNSLSYVEWAQNGAHAPLLILAHGYGSHEQDLFGLRGELPLSFNIVSLRAPLHCPMGGYAWFQIEFQREDFGFSQGEAERGIRALEQSIIEHRDRLEATSVHLVGFSQGGMMVLAAALRGALDVQSAAVLSGRLPDSLLPVEVVAAPAILVQHGKYDPVIDVAEARRCREWLTKKGLAHDYQEYPMAHSISRESLDDLCAWLMARAE
ncbi:MAG: dienelactone hydrolase family protein [Chthonomonas sp.]|nr:dienelactone hydrolase family protein [Chthonomonas sp.]